MLKSSDFVRMTGKIPKSASFAAIFAVTLGLEAVHTDFVGEISIPASVIPWHIIRMNPTSCFSTHSSGPATPADASSTYRVGSTLLCFSTARSMMSIIGRRISVVLL